MSIISRQISTSILSLLGKYPILAVTGPRQSGKTTLLKNLLKNYRYVSLENTDEREFASKDPIGFLKKYDNHIIFDEVQRVPELFSYLQTIVDESGQMGQFVLSGSQNFHLLERITQSLAGRVSIFKLLPLDTSELQQAELLPNNWTSLLLKGFYPAIYDRDLNPSIFYSNYLQTYINRDITQLTKIQDLKSFRNFIGLCAARAGHLLNLSILARECGISQPTAKSWISILESSYILFLLPPYFENFTKRIVKTPKLYFYDVGLLSFLLGIREEQDFNNATLSGHLFENFVVAELFKKNYHQYQLKEYWFWRDANGNEVDLLTKRGNNFDIYEIKSTQTIQSKLLKGLNFFEEIAKNRTINKTILYGGNDSHNRSDFSVKSWNAL